MATATDERKAKATEAKAAVPHLPGDSVWYWREVNGRLQPFPATLISESRITPGTWTVNYQARGIVQGRDAVFSDVAASGRLTVRDASLVRDPSLLGA